MDHQFPENFRAFLLISSKNIPKVTVKKLKKLLFCQKVIVTLAEIWDQGSCEIFFSDSAEPIDHPTKIQVF